MHHVQSILFHKPEWTRPKAREWLRENDFKSTSVDERGEWIHFPQLDPKGFKRIRTHKIGDGSIELHLGYR
jgi:hypothetical protein